MRKILRRLSCLAVLLTLSGCIWAKPHSGPGNLSSEGLLAPYQGLQAKIAVNDFELKTAGAEAQVSAAMKEYFVNILNATKRFKIVPPQDADLIVSVGIIEFIPENSGGKSGLAGGGSSASSFMGGLLGEVLNKATMQLNLRMIDRPTSKVLYSRDIQSQVIEHPGERIKFTQDKAFRALFSDYANTPMGKVIYDCILECGYFIVQNIPPDYYREPIKEKNGKEKT